MFDLGIRLFKYCSYTDISAMLVLVYLMKLKIVLNTLSSLERK